jgi:hypothetical protein
MKDITSILKKALVFGGIAVLLIAAFWVYMGSR